MTTENKTIAKKKQVGLLKEKLYAPSVQEQFKNALGENSNSFIASIIDLYNTDKSLQECDENQVIMEALKAAVLKLPINKSLGYAYILKFKNKGVPTPTFIIGYKGLIQLAMRTGQYRYINADKVYEGELGKKDKLTGTIEFSGEKKSDKVIGYFAHIELLNGFAKTLYATVEEVAKHAKKYSPSIKFDNHVTVESLVKLAGKEPTGIGWTGDFDSMAIKTVLRELLSKYGYLSIEMQNVIAKENEMDYMNERDNDVQDTEAVVIEMNDQSFEEDSEIVEEEEEEEENIEAPY